MKKEKNFYFALITASWILFAITTLIVNSLISFLRIITITNLIS